MTGCIDSPQNCSEPGCDVSDIRLTVQPRIQGNTTLVWEATTPAVAGIATLEARIQFSRYGISNNSAWQTVRDFAANTGIWVDPQQRMFGVDSNTHYRVLMRDASLFAGAPDSSWDDIGSAAIGSTFRIVADLPGSPIVYISKPVRAADYLPRQLQSTYNEIVRRWYARGRRGEIRKGVLLKRIRYGNRCTLCRDRDSGVQIVSQCLSCYGVGWVGGYYRVPQCVYAEFSPIKVDYNFDENRSYFSEGPTSQVKLLNMPQLYPGDVWVESSTDHRWLLGNLLHAQSVGSIKLLTDIETTRLDFTNVIYQFSVD